MFPEMMGASETVKVALCACGCGQEFPVRGYGRPKLYLNASHKSRAYARRKREMTIVYAADLSRANCEALRKSAEAYPEYYDSAKRAALDFLCCSDEHGPLDLLEALKVVLTWLK